MKTEYIRMNEKILPDPALRDRVMDKVMPRPARRFRPAVLAAAVLLVAMIVLPVTAAYVPAVNELMFQVSPEMAARFTPIQESCTKNGIRMEVVSASIHGATAEVCISFEDLEGARIDRQTRVWNIDTRGYSRLLSGSIGGSIGECDYDPETGKLIMVQEKTFSYYSEKAERYQTVRELFGSKMTVQVDQLVRYKELPVMEIPAMWTNNEIMTVYCERGTPNDHVPEVPFDGFGSASSTSGDPWMSRQYYDILTPGEPVYEVTKELTVTGMAYIDGRLHIQTRLRPDDQEEQPIYEVWFQDSEGNSVEWANRNTFTIKAGDDWGYYEESIYDIPETALADLKLMCGIQEKEIIEGPWRVTFPIMESDYVGQHDDGIPMTEAVDH